jgi:hypothetical protein
MTPREVFTALRDRPGKGVGIIYIASANIIGPLWIYDTLAPVVRLDFEYQYVIRSVDEDACDVTLWFNRKEAPLRIPYHHVIRALYETTPEPDPQAAPTAQIITFKRREK